jgi:hypothetical protein
VARLIDIASAHQYKILALIITLFVFILYFPIFYFPFVHDDWEILSYVKFETWNEFAYKLILPNQLHYRPLKWTYDKILYFTLGDTPEYYKILGGFFLVLKALLFFRILQNFKISFFVSVFFVWAFLCAVTINEDLMLSCFWTDWNLPSVLFMLGMEQLTRGNIKNFFLLHPLLLFFNEVYFLYPLIGLVYLLLIKKKSLKDLPFLKVSVVFSVIYLAVRIIVGGIFSTRLINPYHMNLFSGFELDKLGYYLQVFFTPFGDVTPHWRDSFGVVQKSVCLMLFLTFSFMCWRLGRRQFIFIISWVYLASFPILFLSNRVYAYYIYNSLSGFLLVLAIPINELVNRKKMGRLVIPLLFMMSVYQSSIAIRAVKNLADISNCKKYIGSNQLSCWARDYLQLKGNVLPSPVQVGFESVWYFEVADFSYLRVYLKHILRVHYHDPELTVSPIEKPLISTQRVFNLILSENNNRLIFKAP